MGFPTNLVSIIGKLKFPVCRITDKILYGSLIFNCNHKVKLDGHMQAYKMLESNFDERVLQKNPYDFKGISEGRYHYKNLPVFGQLAFLQHRLQNKNIFQNNNNLIIQEGQIAFRNQHQDGTIEIAVFIPLSEIYGHGKEAYAHYYAYNRYDFTPLKDEKEDE